MILYTHKIPSLVGDFLEWYQKQTCESLTQFYVCVELSYITFISHSFYGLETKIINFIKKKYCIVKYNQLIDEMIHHFLIFYFFEKFK